MHGKILIISHSLSLYLYLVVLLQSSRIVLRLLVAMRVFFYTLTVLLTTHAIHGTRNSALIRRRMTKDLAQRAEIRSCNDNAIYAIRQVAGWVERLTQLGIEAARHSNRDPIDRRIFLAVFRDDSRQTRLQVYLILSAVLAQVFYLRQSWRAPETFEHVQIQCIDREERCRQRTPGYVMPGENWIIVVRPSSSTIK